jgi:hypothetical protein
VLVGMTGKKMSKVKPLIGVLDFWTVDCCLENPRICVLDFWTPLQNTETVTQLFRETPRVHRPSVQGLTK